MAVYSCRTLDMKGTVKVFAVGVSTGPYTMEKLKEEMNYTVMKYIAGFMLQIIRILTHSVIQAVLLIGRSHSNKISFWEMKLIWKFLGSLGTAIKHNPRSISNLYG